VVKTEYQKFLGATKLIVWLAEKDEKLLELNSDFLCVYLIRFCIHLMVSMYSHKLYKPSAFLDNLSQLYPRCFEKRILNLFSCFFISSIILFSFQPIADSYGAFCKAVKYKDDGRNDYNIYIGTSQFGIADCIIGTNHKDIILGGDGQDYIKGKVVMTIYKEDLTMIKLEVMMMMIISKVDQETITFMVMMEMMYYLLVLTLIF
jgi:hypothetical protein